MENFHDVLTDLWQMVPRKASASNSLILISSVLVVLMGVGCLWMTDRCDLTHLMFAFQHHTIGS